MVGPKEGQEGLVFLQRGFITEKLEFEQYFLDKNEVFLDESIISTIVFIILRQLWFVM